MQTTLTFFLMKPQHPNEVPNQIWNLTDWDIAMLSTNYIQKGLLFKKPATLVDQQDFMENLLEKLKRSLSLTLSHFYPLALVAESPTKPKTLPLSLSVCLSLPLSLILFLH